MAYGGSSAALASDMETDSRSKLSRYRSYVEQLFNEQNNFLGTWRDLADSFMPMRPRWLQDQQRNRGERRNQQIIDSVPLQCVRDLKAGLHSGLTSPARPWMRLTTADPELAELDEARHWLFTYTQRMLTIFMRSNLYQSLPTLYGDVGVFATGVMSVLEDDEKVIHTRTYPIGSYALGMSQKGVAHAFARKYQRTVEQVVMEFGLQANGRDIDWKNISQSVKDAWNRGNYEHLVNITWLVQPNRDYTSKQRMGPESWRWTSCYWESNYVGDDRFLKESGFETFPFMCPRWEVDSEDTYGTDSPGITSIGDARQLQSEQKVKGQALQKMVKPPLNAPHSARASKVSSLPDDVNYVEDTERGVRAVYEVKPDLSQFREDIAEVQNRLRTSFYNDLFMMLAMSDEYRGAQPMTAREVEERHGEKLLMLSPVYERFNVELFDPLIRRTSLIMARYGLVPPPPPELQDEEPHVEYQSIMAQAMRLVHVSVQDRFVQTVMGMVPVFPEVKHKFDAMQAVDTYAEQLMIDPNLVRSDEEAEKRMAAESAAMQQQAQAEQMAQGSQTVKNLATSPMQDGGTALDNIRQGLGVPPGNV